MAQRYYSINLQNTDIPMLSEQQARTTIVTEAGKAPTQGQAPGIAYCHNVMPTKYGLNSVGYLPQVAALADLPEGTEMIEVKVVYSSNRARAYIAWDNLGNTYALKEGASVWKSLPPTVPSTSGASFSVGTITTGKVNGISYIMYATIGAFVFNDDTDTLDAVVLAGLDITTVLGVVASSGYLIAYTKEAIAWSSTIDPKDFVPSPATGAGGGNVAGIAGAVLYCTSNTLGILISTAANIIAGTYTGNAQFPFKFREVDSSKGGVSLDRVAHEANSSVQFTYSKAGLQSVTSQSAEVILPEVTDFLAGRRFEDYNEITRAYEITELAPEETMLKKLKLIASRYLVVSYGLPSVGYTHALVLDTSLNKVGKLKINHTDVFEYTSQQTEISKETVAFLLSSGEVQTLNFAVDATSKGVVVLGKLQYSFTRFFQLLGVELEDIKETAELDVSSQASLDGKNFTSVLPTAAPKVDSEYREYSFRSTAKSQSLALVGQFALTTVLVRYVITGRR